ncbi:WD40/YVTN/BNR-like repeat-containing protein [Spongiibacter tropicus]|uniref:WD40/YVTN/BNR-like repeat-containing protein n=1 Tax=Spongiibacter tropicus TaxID=454602 RepID=UPI0003B2FD8A|nr:YCF48-related protein [Spongiibacter tropicus]
MTHFFTQALRPRYSVSSLLALTGLLITGCEAPLELEAVHEQASQPLQRTDFYQAMADNGELTLLAGNNGTLLSSRDGGNSWQRQALNTSESFIDLASCPDNSFIALSFDNHLWHGDGQTWQSHELPSGEQMMTVACADNGWWVAGSFSTLQHSGDQGASWQESSLDEDAIITNLQFLDAQNAVATAEYGMVITSRNGGESWAVSGYLPDEFYPHASHFTSASEGWVGGLNGFIYHTADGGESWQRQHTDTQAPIFNFIDSPRGLLALGDNATVLALSNTRWSSLNTPSIPLYLRAATTQGDTLIAAGGRGLLLRIALNDSATPDTNNK